MDRDLLPARYLQIVATWLVLLLVTFVIWKWVMPYVFPFVLAVFVAIALEPLAKRLERRIHSRTAADLLALLVGVGGSVVVVVGVLTVLISELLHLARALPHQLGRWELRINHYLNGLGRLRDALGITSSTLNTYLSTVSKLVESLARGMVTLLTHLPDVLIMLVIAVVAAFFMLRDRDRLSMALRRLFPPLLRKRLPNLKSEVLRGLFGFIKAQAILMVVTMMSTTLGLVLVGSHYAVLAGILAGLMDLVPYLGPTGVLLPWAVLLFVVGNVAGGIKLLAILAGVALVRQSIEPRLMGGNMGLHPLTALFALYLGIQLFGPAGFIIGPISAVVLKAMARALDLLPEFVS